uniref:ShKT domain-containing protein n=1 Tax=Biomphalaria glabrata TaxID=6526 RepID=A0A2C9L849_BIOGL
MVVTNKVFIFLSVVMTCMKDCHGCFPLDDLFIFNRVWKQQTSLFNYTIMTVGTEADDLMQLDFYHGQSLQRTVLMRCLIAYGESRYLVRTENELEEDSLYSCVQFEILTYTIFQMSQTVSDDIRKKVNCVEDSYTEDASIWFANLSYFGVDCPLTGGYQLVTNADNADSLALSPKCFDSIYTYNPRFQFQCDNVKSGNVVLEMGDACTFNALVDRMQIVKRNIVFFRCMGHWSRGSTVSLLLQMQENEGQVWCLQYQNLPHQEGFMPMFLSLDGRCSKDNVFTSGEGRKSMQSVFGALAHFYPPNDPKCRESYNDTQCSENDVCLSSNQCPALCNRCRKEENFNPCKFDAKLRGRWKPVSLLLNYIYVSVDVHSISGYYGDFACRDEQGQDGPNVKQLRLVQTGSVPSCMPFYACLTMKYLAAGILFFEFRSVIRNQVTGEPYSCADGSEKWGHLNLMKTESPLTLFDTTKLTKTGCNVTRQYVFPTPHSKCRLVVHKCAGSCSSISPTFDSSTCSNDTIQANPLQSNHICLGTVPFQDQVYGILTIYKKTSQYFCWIFANTRLFIATPEQCNQKSVSLILEDEDALSIYNPLKQLSEDVEDNAQIITLSITLTLSQYIIVQYFISF